MLNAHLVMDIGTESSRIDEYSGCPSLPSSSILMPSVSGAGPVIDDGYIFMGDHFIQLI